MYTVKHITPNAGFTVISQHETRSPALIEAINLAGEWKSANQNDNPHVTLSESKTDHTAAVLMFKGPAFVGLYSVEPS